VKGRSPRPLDDGGLKRRVAGGRHNQGVKIRPASWDDLGRVVDLLGALNRAATGIGAVTIEHVRNEWQLPSFEVGGDNFVAELGDELVGYAALSSAQGLVLAAWDDGLADELLGRISERARARGFRSLHLTVGSAGDPRAALVARHPFELESETIQMWRSLVGAVEERAWPAGIAVRTFEPSDADKVHGLLDDAYRAWDPHYAPMAHEDWVRWMTGDVEFDPTVWWLAERDGELAGCALHWSGGWLKDLVVRPEDRGCGLGTGLVVRGLAEFARRGVRRVGLKVDAANPTGAIGLYERLGFVADQQEAIWALSL
jgi:mycothiol synthase